MKLGKNLIGILVVVLIAGVVALFLRKRIERFIRNMKEIRAKKKELQLLEDLGIGLTYSPATYTSIANELYQGVSWSWYNPNCDETATQKALMKLYTDRDYMELAVAFGVRDTYSMETYVQSCLNASEKNLINQTWSQRGMTIKI